MFLRESQKCSYINVYFLIYIIEFFRGLEISGKIFSRRYEPSRGFEQGI